MQVTIPDFCLIALVGPTGSGKSTFARTHFAPTEVLSSDACRGMVRDDPSDQAATADAFEVLYFIARKRLAARRLTVVDATNVRREDRQKLVTLAREYHAQPVALVFDLPEELCRQRSAQAADRDFGPHVVRNQIRSLRGARRGLRREGFRFEHRFTSAEEVDAVRIERQRLWTDRRDEHGPFDIIGDLHGCFDELAALLDRLGYRIERHPGSGGDRFGVSHPHDRRLIFLGDLVDRGPKAADCLRLVMDAVAGKVALCVPGNHDVKLLRALRGRNVQLRHGLQETFAQLDAEPPELRERVERFLDGLISHYLLDDGRLVVAHAGMREEMQGRASNAVRAFALYGETTGETDEFGLPVRYRWAGDYRGSARVVYGHTPVPQAEWVNRTICIDTGCVFGGALTALRYPEEELVAVPAARVYCEPVRPLAPAADAARTAQQAHDDLLDLDDVRGKRFIATRLHGGVTIREGNAAAALEVMSRFAVDPRWLIYLPPTMAPSDTTREAGMLEHPVEAFEFYAERGARTVVCEQKHMGSRAVLIVCRDEHAATRRFGVPGDELGILYTRTGRRFFAEAAIERQVLERVRAALAARGFWDRFDTDWACLDCEVMPWSAKAEALLRTQYGPVASASRIGLGAAVEALQQAVERGVAAEELHARYRARAAMADAYAQAYRRYCWPVGPVEDLRIAPFHLLATEGVVHADKDHGWHMETLAGLCGGGEPILQATPFRTVELEDDDSRGQAIAWWQELTEAGGEGMVVKPWQFAAVHGRRLLQPALKCRGREYLRIIYGPEYTAEEHLRRLRQRGVGAKRSLAVREFALGIEGLERFIRGEPLRQVHECAFAVLALESEPVDPRL